MSRIAHRARVCTRGLVLSGVLALVFGLFGVASVFGEASHAGWPEINCARYLECHQSRMQQSDSAHSVMRGADGVHNELLGGGGSDTIYAGNDGDVIWGDANPGAQPEGQVNHLYGGAGDDWIYASYGTNYIWTGAGNDHVFLTYGHGVVHCNGPGLKTLWMPWLKQNDRYQLIGCDHVVNKALQV
jgi:hypothetical protein